MKTSTWDEEGRTIILGYWVAGDVIGQPLSRIDPYEIKCLTYVETARVPLQACVPLQRYIAPLKFIVDC